MSERSPGLAGPDQAKRPGDLTETIHGWTPVVIEGGLDETNKIGSTEELSKVGLSDDPQLFDGINSSNDFFAYVEGLDVENNQFEISYQLQKKILEKYFELQQNGIFYDNFPPGGIFMPHLRPPDERLNITDNTLLACLEMINNGHNIGNIYEILNLQILQNIHMVKPEILLTFLSQLDFLLKQKQTLNKDQGFVHHGPSSMFEDGKEYSVSGGIGQIYQMAIGWTTYGLGFGDIDSVLEKIKTGSMDEQPLSIIDVLPKIILDACGDGDFAHDAIWKLYDKYAEFAEQTDNFILKSRAARALSIKEKVDSMGLADYDDYIDELFYGIADSAREKASLWASSDLVSQKFIEVDGIDGSVFDLCTEYYGVYDFSGILVAFIKKVHGETHYTQGDILDIKKLFQSEKIPDEYTAIKEIQDYTWMSGLETRSELVEGFGINIEQLAFREQFWLLSYLKKASSEDLEGLADFVCKYGKDGLRTFLSSQYGEENGLKVLKLSDQADQKTVEKIFALYGEIVDSANAIIVSGEKYDQAELSEGLLRRAKELLLSAYAVVNSKNGDIGIDDVITALELYRDFIFSYSGSSEIENGGPRDNLYSLLEKNKDSEDLSGLVATFIAVSWHRQVNKQNSESKTRVIEDTEAFYKEWAEMNKEASTTTGDTERELERTASFLKYVVSLGGKDVCDIGCGDGSRITEPLSLQFPEISFTGVDLLAPTGSSRPNVEYRKGDLTRLSEVVGDESYDALFSTWSVANDVLRREDQARMVVEFSNALKQGGQLFIDVPYLEGGEGSWKKAADQYHVEHPDKPYGALVVDFGSRHKKQFYIYPIAELVHLLNEAGLEVVSRINTEPINSNNPFESPEWVTAGGKPRITLIAKKIGRPSSELLLLSGSARIKSNSK